ncbi:MAG: ACP S-malonyltransferase, partial [Alphaproteobacteria bacterium]|nr:ACP S-malonyltransferase [Alphaproteobacteria bacterium]
SDLSSLFSASFSFAAIADALAAALAESISQRNILDYVKPDEPIRCTINTNHADSPRTEPAEEPMSSALMQTNIKIPAVPVIANVTAKQTISPDEIRSNLISQICDTVRWRETMDELNRLGIKELVEIGSGKVLSGLAKKTPHNFKVTNISTIAEMEQFLSDI